MEQCLSWPKKRTNNFAVSDKFFAGDTERKFLKVHIERNVKVCLSEQDFPVGSCQFKETFALNFLEAHRDLH